MLEPAPNLFVEKATKTKDAGLGAMDLAKGARRKEGLESGDQLVSERGKESLLLEKMRINDKLCVLTDPILANSPHRAGIRKRELRRGLDPGGADR